MIILFAHIGSVNTLQIDLVTILVVFECMQASTRALFQQELAQVGRWSKIVFILAKIIICVVVGSQLILIGMILLIVLSWEILLLLKSLNFSLGR